MINGRGISVLAILAATVICKIGITDDVKQRAFSTEGKIFFQSPEYEMAWIEARDSEKTCRTLRKVTWDAQGAMFQDSAEDRYLFFGVDGSVYERFGVDAWKKIGHGNWFKPVNWTYKPENEKHMRLRVWKAMETQFVNGPTEKSPYWYQVDQNMNCHWFEAAKASYGPVGVQSVELTSPLPELPAWTLKNGQAKLGHVLIPGDWRDNVYPSYPKNLFFSGLVGEKIRGLAFQRGVVFRHPLEHGHWVVVSDETRSCLSTNELRKGVHGSLLRSTSTGESFFVSQWNILYKQKDDKSKWEVVSDGNAYGWHPWTILADTAEKTSMWHRMVWLAENEAFINDPRASLNQGTSRGLVKPFWYHFKLNGSCETLRAQEHHYKSIGELLLQNSVLSRVDEKTPLWELANGTASSKGVELPGTWLTRDP